ncbi:hypothetical protein SLE2022_106720 [Rubroshorea leprosula]
MSCTRILSLAFLLLFINFNKVLSFSSTDYRNALTKSLLYFEAQRSGKLPPNHRVDWRGDSGLNDGQDVNIDLTGGYYDAGDHVKFGFTLAFTITTLSWSTLEFQDQLTRNKEFSNALSAIKWGTDYLIKAHPQPNVLYGQVGEGDPDHACWMRPEQMTTPRTSYKIDEQRPGADLAAETAAAFAAASIVFQGTDASYSKVLLNHARQLFDFARTHPGLYQNSINDAGKFYSSSGYEDELLWAAAWLYRATNGKPYLDFLNAAGNTGGTRTTFSWDDKYVGAQVLVAKLVLEKKVPDSGVMAQFKNQAEQFICACAQKGNGNVKKTPGGLLWFLPFNNLQYTATATLVASAYSNYLSAAKSSIQCPGGILQSQDLVDLARSQVDYILGSNPKKMSYMVGFGNNFPGQVHHRAASIVSIKKDPTPVSCKEGFDKWFNKNEPNPNVLEGGVVGGPDANDAFTDSRGNFQQSEPATVTPAPLVGVFAFLAK